MMANTPPDNSDPKKVPPSGSDCAGPGMPARRRRRARRRRARTVHDVIAALQAEAADLKDKWMRAHAEIENIRKRAEREKEEIAKYAITKLARDIVGVGDNLQRAIGAIPAGAAEQDPALKSFLEGVMLTERDLLNALERHGIKRLQPVERAVQPASASGGHGDAAQRRARGHHRGGVPGRAISSRIACCAPPWWPWPRAGRSLRRPPPGDAQPPANENTPRRLARGVLLRRPSEPERYLMNSSVKRPS